MSESRGPAAGAAAEWTVDYESWRARVEAEPAQPGELARLSIETLDRIPVEPLYTDRHPREHRPDEAGFPGLWPYTRGARPRPTERRGWEVWSLVELSEGAPPAAVAEEIEGGCDGLWMRLDRDARLGLDGGRAGSGDRQVVRSRAELSALLVVPASVAPPAVALDAGANALPVAALALALDGGVDHLDGEGTPADGAGWSFGADPLAALASDGELPAPLAVLEAEMGRLAAFCAADRPAARPVAVSALPYHQAGASAGQELGFALATGVHYLRVLERGGLEPAVAAGGFEFRLAVGRDLFLAVAKLRAARWLWAELLAACGADPAPPARIHAVTSARTLSGRERRVNIVRAAGQAWAAAVGGADAVTCLPCDAAAGPSGPAARRLARTTQLVLAEEGRLARVLDPAGGSYYLEYLTGELARAAWAELQAVEAAGGMAAALLSGEIGGRIETVWAKRSERLARRLDPVTGVSEYADPQEVEPPRSESGPGPSLAARSRAEAGVVGAAASPDHAIGGPQGAQGVGDAPVDVAVEMDALVRAAVNGATIAELGRLLRRSGVGERIAPLPRRRDAAAFEALRAAADELAAAGRRPAVFLANLGEPRAFRERAAFARRLFQAGGFQVAAAEGTGQADPGQAAAHLATEFTASGASAACLCGSAADQGRLGPAVAIALSDAGARPLLAVGEPGELAAKSTDAVATAGPGRPPRRPADWPAAAIEYWLHPGCDALAILDHLLTPHRDSPERPR